MRAVKRETENQWSQTREIIVAIYNVNRDSSVKPTPFVGKDIIHLSFDDEKVENIEKIETDNAEYFKQMKARFGSTIKKNG